MDDNVSEIILQQIQNINTNIQSINEHISEIEVHMAEHYVTQDNCNKSKLDNKEMHRSLVGWIIAIYALITSAALAYFFKK